jgi:hypothetical protein
MRQIRIGLSLLTALALLAACASAPPNQRPSPRALDFAGTDNG